MTKKTDNIGLEKESGYNENTKNKNLDLIDKKTVKVLDEDPDDPDEEEAWLNDSENKVKWYKGGQVREVAGGGEVVDGYLEVGDYQIEGVEQQTTGMVEDWSQPSTSDFETTTTSGAGTLSVDNAAGTVTADDTGGSTNRTDYLPESHPNSTDFEIYEGASLSADVEFKSGSGTGGGLHVLHGTYEAVIMVGSEIHPDAGNDGVFVFDDLDGGQPAAMYDLGDTSTVVADTSFTIEVTEWTQGSISIRVLDSNDNVLIEDTGISIGETLDTDQGKGVGTTVYGGHIILHEVSGEAVVTLSKSTPKSHGGSHGRGGSDEVDITGYSGTIYRTSSTATNSNGEATDVDLDASNYDDDAIAYAADTGDFLYKSGGSSNPAWIHMARAAARGSYAADPHDNTAHSTNYVAEGTPVGGWETVEFGLSTSYDVDDVASARLHFANTVDSFASVNLNHDTHPEGCVVRIDNRDAESSRDVTIGANSDATEEVIDTVPLASMRTYVRVATSGEVSDWRRVALNHGDLEEVSSDDHHTRPSAGTLLQENSGAFDVQEASIDHDALTNVAADEHVGIIRDTAANRPSAGTAGRLFIETDTGRTLYDDGTDWIEVGLSESEIHLGSLGVHTHANLDNIGSSDHHIQPDAGIGLIADVTTTSITFDVDETGIDHDLLVNYAAEEHLAEESATDNATGDGSQTTFTINHGLGVDPTHIDVTPQTAPAAAEYYVSGKNSTEFDIIYTTAPQTDATLEWSYVVTE